MAGHDNLNNETPDELMNEIARYESIINGIGDAISIQGLDFRVLYQNEAHRKLTGAHLGELCYVTYKNKTSVCEGCPVALAYQDGNSHIAVEEQMTDHGPVYSEVTVSPIRNARGEIIAGMKIARDVTARKLAEEALQKSEEFVKNILESIGEGLIVIDRDYRIISANSAYIENAKRTSENIIGGHCYRISHNSDIPCFEAGEHCPVRITFETGEPSQALHIHTDLHGNSAYVEVKAYPMKDDDGRTVSVIETINDITSQRKLEDQLRNAQKLEAIGQLAGGIAHDFNNILTAILGYGNLLQMNLDDSSPIRHKIDQIVSSAEKAANLTQSLLAYSRTQIINPQPVKINGVISKIETILSRLISEEIELKIILTDKDPTTVADSGQLEQVLMNLVTNARDAMPRGGDLTIQTGLVDIDEKYTNTHPHIRARSHVVISVADTGIGMDENTQGKIFDPFFTTKEVGKGTGLGLAMAYGILRQHDGFINVSSETGKGTTFSVYLPAVETEVISPGTPEAVVAPGGHETILMAEDDAEVRRLIKNILENFGYTVILTENGEEAVAGFIANRGSIDLLLMDVIMPKKNGKAAFEEIRALKPDIKALFMSGHTSELLRKEAKLEPGMDFISKPVSIKDLLLKVREVLDKRP